MCFDSLPLAQKFYANYAKKVGFVTKVRNTNFDKTKKKSKIPINQAIHCTRESYRESWVKAATRANRIIATRCRTRMYVMLDREKESWIVSRLKLRYSHPCSTKKAVHYHEYRELTMHAKCVRCVGTAPRGDHHYQCKAMAGAIRKVLSDTVHQWCIWHILKKSQFKLKGYTRYRELNAKMNHIVWNSPSANSFKNFMPIDESSTGIERQFQREYTSNKFRDVQLELRKRADCIVRPTEQHGDSISIKVDEQKIV
ncbi:hypothetical protein Ahy_B10g100742 [Arachis hypogaea]|uniref:FAR1 domain-containing protein n=1 Tax=Arachis hypogaea TaxID=3818 RepID=A0A444WXL8_ARAHY|nr:hypothetical protein Ahy_B10g100742 [Arachis hypogaea]